MWDRDRDDLVARIERRLGRLDLGTVERRPSPGLPATTALLDRVRSTGLAALPWTDRARSLQARVGFLRAVIGEPWPDLSDAALRRTLDERVERLMADNSRSNTCEISRASGM